MTDWPTEALDTLPQAMRRLADAGHPSGRELRYRASLLDQIPRPGRKQGRHDLVNYTEATWAPQRQFYQDCLAVPRPVATPET